MTFDHESFNWIPYIVMSVCLLAAPFVMMWYVNHLTTPKPKVAIIVPKRKVLRYPTKYYCVKHLTLFQRAREFCVVTDPDSCAACVSDKNKLTPVTPIK